MAPPPTKTLSVKQLARTVLPVLFSRLAVLLAAVRLVLSTLVVLLDLLLVPQHARLVPLANTNRMLEASLA